MANNNLEDNKKNNLIEGEVIEPKEAISEEIREAGKRGGVFIGTLNIMTEPARQYLTKPLDSIYHARYEKKYKNPLAVFLFDAALVLLGAIAAAAAIYFSFFSKTFEPIKLNLSVLPAAPVSGGEIVIKINVQNNTADDVNADVALRLPKTISLKSSSLPFDRTDNIIHFNTIEGGMASEARLTAALTGAIGTKQKITGELSYVSAANGKKGKTLVTTVFNISRSLVSAVFELPEKIVVGQRFSGKIRYANKGGADVQDVYLALNWPAGFILEESDLGAANGRYALGTIKANVEGTFGWSGTLVDASAGADFSAELDAKSGNEFIEQAFASDNPSVTDPKIKLAVRGPAAAKLGNLVAYSLEIKNNGDLTFTNADLRLVSANGITASKIENIPSVINPGDEIKTNLQINLPSALTENLAAKNNPTLEFSLSLKAKLGGDDVAISSPIWNVKVASVLGIQASARYWSSEGDQLGRGPLPPEAGKTTRYWIFWNITNTTSAVSGVNVTASLPPNLVFTGKSTASSGDNIIFNPTTRTVSWSVGDVPPFPGSGSDALGAGFEVALTPTAAEIGAYPPLLTNVKIFGNDSFSGLALAANADDVSAKLIDDPRAARKGPVVGAP